MGDLKIAELGILDMIIAVTGVLSAVAAVGICIWLICNWKQYKKSVDGVEYRRKNGLFNIGQYINSVFSISVSTRQKNRGPKPENFNRDIPCIDYFDILGFSPIQDTSKRRQKKRSIVR